MSGQNVRRLSFVLALTASLVLGPTGAWALPVGSDGSPAVSGLGGVGVLSELWGLLTRTFGTSDAGMWIDPNGTRASSEGDGDEGTWIDPDGATTPSGGDGDEGTWIDPDG